VNTAHRVLGGDGPFAPAGNSSCRLRPDKLDAQAIGVTKPEHTLAETGGEGVMLDTLLDEALQPPA
jgi:hypothetical protein